MDLELECRGIKGSPENWTFTVLNYLFSPSGRFGVFHWWVLGWRSEEKRQGGEAELAEAAKQKRQGGEAELAEAAKQSA